MKDMRKTGVVLRERLLVSPAAQNKSTRVIMLLQWWAWWERQEAMGRKFV